MVSPVLSPLCRNDKKEKAAVEGPDEKELKKKEKQRLEKEKKEQKERQEREKKEQKEREKKESEMKKKFQVSGTSQLLREEELGKVSEEPEEGGERTNLSGFIPRRSSANKHMQRESVYTLSLCRR